MRSRTHLCNLIDPLARIIRVHVLVLSSKVAPLPAVHGTEVTFLTFGQADRVKVIARGVAVPDLDTLVL